MSPAKKIDLKRFRAKFIPGMEYIPINEEFYNSYKDKLPVYFKKVWLHDPVDNVSPLGFNFVDEKPVFKDGLKYFVDLYQLQSKCWIHFEYKSDDRFDIFILGRDLKEIHYPPPMGRKIVFPPISPSVPPTRPNVAMDVDYDSNSDTELVFPDPTRDTTTQTELRLIDSNGKRFESFIARGWSKNHPKKFLGDGWDRFHNFQQLRDGDVCVFSMGENPMECFVEIRRA